MLITLDKTMINAIIERMEAQLRSYGYNHEVESLRHVVKKNTISLFQHGRNLKAILRKTLYKVKQSIHNTHFITENILIQTTYYKTLTSRP